MLCYHVAVFVFRTDLQHVITTLNMAKQLTPTSRQLDLLGKNMLIVWLSSQSTTGSDYSI